MSRANDHAGRGRIIEDYFRVIKTCDPTMDSDKENICKTKIPIPRKPLPALPLYLLTENKNAPKHDKMNTRIPLQTIHSRNSPKPCSSNGAALVKRPMNFCMKNITLRQSNKDSACNYNIFKDETSKTDSITISSDEKLCEETQQQDFAETQPNNDLEVLSSSSTPAVYLNASAEINGIRNIKRSLKRPHSRELQGLSPFNVQDKIINKVKRRLHFNVNSQDILESPKYFESSHISILDDVYSADIVHHLLVMEKLQPGTPRISNITRACVFNWLMKVNGANGNPFTIQTACWYLDSVLRKGDLELSKMQLVAAACYWIAQKLHGPLHSAGRLVKCANKAFTTENLVIAEKIVLKKLRFPSQPVVPQEYITYLAWYCDPNHGAEIEEAATFLTLCGMMVNKALCNEYPSVIAVAAIDNAIMMLHLDELRCRLIVCPVYKTAEKKGTQLSEISSTLCTAVRTISESRYEYKTLLQHYGCAPRYIAQNIVNAAHMF